jgi:phosphohistidine phosphatase SixA
MLDTAEAFKSMTTYTFFMVARLAGIFGRGLIAVTLLIWAQLISAQASGSSTPIKFSDGTIVLFRHANAPGIGDPPNFKLADCRTQRNLDAVGRAQAKRLGEYLRANGASVQRVYSSQWCRCLETASIAFEPEIKKLTLDVRSVSAFNSFFRQNENEPAQTLEALKQLNEWRGPGVLVVVTHQVNISAITGEPASAGEGVVMQKLDGKLKVLGRIQP